LARAEREVMTHEAWTAVLPEGVDETDVSWRWYRVGVVRHEAGRCRAATTALRRALDCPDAWSASSRGRAVILVLIGRCEHQAGHREDAAAAFVGAIEAFDAARARSAESGELVAGEVLRAASMSAMQLGFLSQDAEDWGSAIRWFELGHELHEQLGEPYEAALAADMGALAAWRVDRFDDAFRLYGRAVELAELLDADRRDERVASARTMTGYLLMITGADPALAAAHLREAHDLMRRLGDVAGAAVAREHLSTAQDLGGHVEEAFDSLAAARSSYAKLGDEAGVARCRRETARLLFKSGDLSGAATELTETAARCAEVDQHSSAAEVCELLADVHRAAGDPDAAEAAMGRAVLYYALAEDQDGATRAMRRVRLGR
jgi:tetratricopeptide (TPR) repeat protein